MVDRYTKAVLTLIACALVYLCVMFTPLPGAHAQTPSPTPGVSSGPTEVIVVGWKPQEEVRVTFRGPVQVAASQPLPITGTVATQPASDRASRVILVGWEENANRDRATTMESLSNNGSSNSRRLPVQPPK